MIGLRRATPVLVAGLLVASGALPFSAPVVSAAPPAGVAIGDATVAEGTTGGLRTVALTVILDEPQATLVTVAYTTAPGSADATDYKPRSGVVRFNAGVTKGYVSLKVLPDAVAEGDETFTVELSAPTGGVGLDHDTGVVTIVDDEAAAPGVSVGDATVWNGDTNTRPNVGKVAVTLDAPAATAVEVTIESTSWTAAGGVDFKYVTGSYGTVKKVKFQPGQVSKVLPFTLYPDADDEPDEYFTIDVISVSGAGVSDGSGTVVILDDDEDLIGE